MPVMTLMFLPSVLPLRFPLLNLSVRNRNGALSQCAKLFKRCWLGLRHIAYSQAMVALNGNDKSQVPIYSRLAIALRDYIQKTMK